MIDQILSGQRSKQLIPDLDCSIALNKGFVLALNSEIKLLKLNSSEHIIICSFLLKFNDLLHQVTVMKFTAIWFQERMLATKTFSS